MAYPNLSEEDNEGIQELTNVASEERKHIGGENTAAPGNDTFQLLAKDEKPENRAKNKPRLNTIERVRIHKHMYVIDISILVTCSKQNDGPA